ncbi:MAG: tetratricopeptide repeat protein, partial [Bacteroidia bacterium]
MKNSSVKPFGLTLFYLFILFFCCLKSNAQDNKGVTVNNMNEQSSQSLLSPKNTYSLIIGISKYEHFNSLQYADMDAIAFYSFLRSPAGGGVDSSHIRIIVNDKAKSGDIWRDIGWLLRSATKAGDRALIYFSGHGDAANSDEAYLLAYDAPNEGDPNLYNAGGTFQVYNLKSKIKQMTTEGVEVVLITDACRSNELPGKADGKKWAGDKIMEKQAGEIMMASCASNEVSLEDIQWGGGRGVFSYHLVNGLAGMADKNGDGQITLRELERYVTDSVEECTKYLSTGKPRQTPVFCCAEYRETVLGLKDQQFLSDLMKNNSSENNLLTLAGKGKKGIDMTDLKTKDLYVKYETALSEGRLIDSSGCAAILLDSLLQNIKDENTRADLADMLVAQLVNSAQKVINDYSKGKDPSNQNLSFTYFFNASKKLSKALEYVQDKEYYNELNASCLFLEARALKESQYPDDWKKGIVKADSSLLLKPGRAHVLHTLGLLYSRLKENDKALHYEYRAIAEAPNWTYSYLGLGSIYCELKQSDSALYYYRKALRINVKDESAYQGIGAVYANLKQSDSALYYYRKAIRINPKYESAYRNIGLVYKNLNQTDSALHYYREAIRINPKDEPAYNSIGVVYYNLKQTDSALYYYHEAIRINPKYEDAYNGIGVVYDDLNQTDSALYYYREAIRINPKYESAYHNIGLIYDNLKQSDSALYYYHKTIRINPKYELAYRNIGLVYQNLNQTDSALQYFRKAININPKYEDAYNDIGVIYQHLKQNDSALYYYREAIRINPKGESVYYNNIGTVYGNLKQTDSALYYYLESIRINPKNESAYRNIGLVYDNLKQTDSALQYFRKAININPK